MGIKINFNDKSSKVHVLRKGEPVAYNQEKMCLMFSQAGGMLSLLAQAQSCKHLSIKIPHSQVIKTDVLRRG